LLKAIQRHIFLPNILLFQIGLYSDSNVIKWIESIGIKLSLLEWAYILRGLSAKTSKTDFLASTFDELAVKFESFDLLYMMQELLESSASYGNLIIFEYLSTRFLVLFAGTAHELIAAFVSFINMAGQGNHLNIIKYIHSLNIVQINPLDFDCCLTLDTWKCGRDNHECFDFVLEKGYIELNEVITWALQYNSFSYLEELEKRFADTEKKFQWFDILYIASQRYSHIMDARAQCYCLERFYKDPNNATISRTEFYTVYSPKVFKEIKSTFIFHSFTEGLDLLVEKGITTWTKLAISAWTIGLNLVTRARRIRIAISAIFCSLEYCKSKISHKPIDYSSFKLILEEKMQKDIKRNKSRGLKFEPFVKWLNANSK
jgi:hypothetical protein